MNQHSRTGPSVRSVTAGLGLLAGLLSALILALGGQAARLGPTNPIASAGGQGYWLLATDGGIFGYGDAAHLGTNLDPGNDIVGLAPTPTMEGYWTADDDGTVFAYGDAAHLGNRASTANDIGAFAARPQGDGYWLATRDGAVYAYGAAPYRGNTPALGSNQEIVGMTATPSGDGYWLVGRNGGIFAFGDAGFLGSTGAMRLNRPIVGMARTPSGDGYWFTAADGGVFAFGAAGFHGSTASNPPASGITAMASTPSGNGYWLVAGNGKVFPFGDAAHFGDPSGSALNQPVVGIAATPVVRTNTVPAAVADRASLAEDGSASLDVLANDAGLDDTPVTLSIVTGPAHGTASVAGPRIGYSPAANSNGSDSITYRVTDADGESSTAVVALAVTAVNDAPVASNGSLSTSEDTLAGGTLVASDIDGDGLTFSVVTPPAHGSVLISGSSYTFTPAADYHGPDSFTFRANDGSADSNTATVSITVDPVNDAPVIVEGDGPLALPIDEDDPDGEAVALSAGDIDGDTLTWSASDPAHGSVSGGGSTGDFTYTPDADFDGSESFTITVSDGKGGTDTFRVDVVIGNLDNDAPSVSAISGQEMDEDTTLEIPFTVSDPDTGDVLDITVGSSDPVLLPSGALTLSGAGTERTLAVHPAADLSGTAHLFVMVSDGEAPPRLQDVELTVNPVNDVPVVATIGNRSTNEDVDLVISFTVEDADPTDTLSITAGSSDPTLLPAGALTPGGSGVNRTLTVDTPLDLYGSAQVFLSVSDGHAAPVVQTFLLSVNPVNDAPVFAGTGDSGAGDEETLITGTVHAGDPDTGDTLTYSIEAGDEAADGSAAVDPTTGAWTYTGDADFAGGDSFTITVTDDGTGNLTDTIVVGVTVDNVDDDPVIDEGASDLSPELDNDTLLASGHIEAGDADSDPLTFSIVGAPAGITIGGNGDYTYDGNIAVGSSFTVEVSDGAGPTDTVAVNVVDLI